MKYGELPEVETTGGQKLSGFPVVVPHPPKSALLRLPTSDEVIGRLSKQKSIRKSLGRRMSKTEHVPMRDADLVLFNTLRIDSGEQFDEYEASDAVNKLLYCEVLECEREGNGYIVTLKTPLAVTKHVVGTPSRKDVTVYRSSVLAVTDLPHGVEELRFRIEPAATLYDAVAKSIEGYADGISTKDVPPHHKSAVVVEVIQAIDDLDPAIDPNF